jgi:hypothetical protein
LCVDGQIRSNTASYDARVVKEACRTGRRGMPTASAGGNGVRLAKLRNNLGDSAHTKSDPGLQKFRVLEDLPTTLAWSSRCGTTSSCVPSCCRLGQLRGTPCMK